MYLLSLRLAPSPWTVTMVSGTAQYTVPSVSTQTMTPRRVGFFACASAPPRAEPAGPSVWCTIMLRHGWAFSTSPHGASQTIFRPGISGVPEARAMVSNSGGCAAATGANITNAQSAVSVKRNFMDGNNALGDQPIKCGMAQGPLRAALQACRRARSGTPAVSGTSGGEAL